MAEAVVVTLTFLSFVLLAAVVLVLRDRLAAFFWRRRNPPEKLAELEHAYMLRLTRPDWSYYARQLGRSPPEKLRAWFESPERLGRDYFFGDYHVRFAPLDPQGQTEAAWVLPDILPFASSDGDPIFLKPGASEASSVHIAYHDGGGTEQLAADVASFLEGLRHDA